MKKFFLVLAIIVLIITGFVFLEEKASSDDEIVFWTLQMGDFAPYMNELIEQYEKMHPEVKIKWIDVPFSEGEKRTLAAVLSNNPPDLINLNPDFSALLAQRGALEEIEPEYLFQFDSGIVEALKYNDKVYSLPWYATSAVTYYNKDLVAKAEISELPKTYEDLNKYSEQVYLKTSKYAYMPTITENDTMLKILNKYGINSSKTVNSEDSIKIFDGYKMLYQKGYIPKESITQTQREALEKYMSGDLAFFQAGANFLNMVRENAPTIYKSTDVFPQIVGTVGQNDFSLMTFVIPLKAKNKKQALKFVLFLTNSENQLELAKLTNVIATNKKTLQNEYYQIYNEKDIMAKARVISAMQLNNITPALKQVNSQKELNALINTAVQEVLTGKKDTKKVLDKLAKDWQKL